MSLFLALNRLLRALVVGLMLLGVWMLWERRERARPWLDLYVLWEACGYKAPPPVDTTPVLVVKVLAENVIQARDTNKVVWNVGLEGLRGAVTDGDTPRLRKFAYATQTNLTGRLVGRTVDLAITQTLPDRVARGFVYEGTNASSLALELVASGRLRWVEDSTRMLPLREQVALRGADRRARDEGLGLWAGSE
ncbi:MAG: hypothetical protein KF791_09480 [Verrucomicrobiae bacterium]|nr:hypothetical protein [Verrucomicrobiae bacterium]